MQNSPQEKFRCNFRLNNRITASIIDKRVVARANEKAQYSHVSLSSKWHFHVLAQFLVAKKGGGDIGQKRERVVSMESFHKFSSHEISRACWYYLSKDKLQITAPNSTNYQRYGPYKTPKWLKFRVSLGCKQSFSRGNHWHSRSRCWRSYCCSSSWRSNRWWRTVGHGC